MNPAQMADLASRRHPGTRQGRVGARESTVYAPSRHRKSWTVDDYLDAPDAVREALRTRYAEALAERDTLPALAKHDEAKDRPSFSDPAGEPMSPDLADHLAREIELLREAEEAGRLARRAAGIQMDPPDWTDLFDPRTDA